MMQTPRQAALHLWNLGANITAIAEGEKRPVYEWNSPKAPWAAQRQPKGYVGKLQWPTEAYLGNGGRLIAPIDTVGAINGISGWRTLDVDAVADETGHKTPVPESVRDAILNALDLDPSYAWAGRSKSGAGWHIWIRCEGELPERIAVAVSSRGANDGGGPGVKVGIPNADHAGDFDHIEIRWERCQSVLPHPCGYNGSLPSDPPAVVTVEQLVAAFDAVAVPKPPKGRTAPPVAAPPVAAPSARSAERIDVDRTKAAVDAAGFDLVQWFCQELRAEAQAEGGEIRILGNGGLLVKGDVWYDHSGELGGGWVKAVAYTRHNGAVPRGRDYIELLRVAAAFAGVPLVLEPERDERRPAPPAGGTQAKANDQAEDSEESDGERVTQAQALITLGMQADLFTTPEGEPYARCKVNGHTETWAIRERGSSFRTWLVHRFYQLAGRPPSSSALSSALEVLDAHARFEGGVEHVFTRVASHDGRVYLDLADPDWRTVEISQEGWRIVDRAPVAFRRPRGMLPLPEPERGGRLDELRAFLNVSDSDWVLMQGWLLGALMPEGPYAHMALYGEMGSGKSNITRLLRAIIDPNEAMARAMPKEERDLAIAARNSRIVAFDNLSYLPSWLSDALCRLSTGAASSTRALYSDDDETLFSAKRPCIFNGIAEVATRGDLIDRTLTISLQPIKTGHKSERALWDAFYLVRPRILGGLLDAAVAALRNEGKVTLPWLPRMADFALWVEGAAGYFGWPRGVFAQALGAQRDDAVAIELEASLVAQAFDRVMQVEAPWSGSASQLLDLLELSFGIDAKGNPKRPREGWPKDPTRLAGELRRVAPALRTVGLDVSFPPPTGRNRRRIIKVDRCDRCDDRYVIADSPTQRSPSAPHQEAVDGTRQEGVIAEIAKSPHPSVQNRVREGGEEKKRGMEGGEREDSRDTAISAITPLTGEPDSASGRPSEGDRYRNNLAITQRSPSDHTAITPADDTDPEAAATAALRADGAIVEPHPSRGVWITGHPSLEAAYYPTALAALAEAYPPAAA